MIEILCILIQRSCGFGKSWKVEIFQFCWGVFHRIRSSLCFCHLWATFTTSKGLTFRPYTSYLLPNTRCSWSLALLGLLCVLKHCRVRKWLGPGYVTWLIVANCFNLTWHLKTCIAFCKLSNFTYRLEVVEISFA